MGQATESIPSSTSARGGPKDAGHQPAVSVILPTYQRRELVGRAVASVFAQTLGDFELIVVDDGSSDGTREALAAVRDHRLHYHWQANRGAAAARNAALRLARGEIVAFLDSDDVWLPHHLAVVTEMLSRHPEAVLATTGPRYATGRGPKPGEAHLMDPLPEQFYAHPAGYTSCAAARRKRVVESGGFDERLVVHEDVELFMRLALRGPFALAQRRTFIKQYTPGLKDWGRRRGHYLDAAEHKARRAIEELQRLPGPRAQELRDAAEGALHFAAALRALDDQDEASTRAALARACLALPGLSRQGELVDERLEILPLAHDPAERLGHLKLAAESWPDPGADAALFLRCCALLAALRLRRLGEARTLIAGWPLRPMPGFLRRSHPALASRARRKLDARRYRTRERVDRDWRAASDRLARRRPATPGLGPG